MPKLLFLLSNPDDNVKLRMDREVQSFIKPIEDIEQFKKGLDEAYIFPDFELKTSEAYFSILDYNIEKKKLNLIVYLKNYRFHFDNSFLQEAV